MYAGTLPQSRGQRRADDSAATLFAGHKECRQRSRDQPKAKPRLYAHSQRPPQRCCQSVLCCRTTRVSCRAGSDDVIFRKAVMPARSTSSNCSAQVARAGCPIHSGWPGPLVAAGRGRRRFCPTCRQSVEESQSLSDSRRPFRRRVSRTRGGVRFLPATAAQAPRRAPNREAPHERQTVRTRGRRYPQNPARPGNGREHR
jgi:hypothetical protein